MKVMEMRYGEQAESVACDYPEALEAVGKDSAILNHFVPGLSQLYCCAGHQPTN